MWMWAMIWVMAHAREVREGTDEFGRRCALVDGARIEALIEDEWYVGARDRALRASGDDTPAEVEVIRVGGRAQRFALWLPSATGYRHDCVLNP